MKKPVAIVGANIRIRNCPSEMRVYFDGKLRFDNPEYYKREATGRWTGATPAQIVLYERDGYDLIVPFGMLPEVFAMRNSFGKIVPTFKMDSPSFDYGSKIKLYDYQEDALAFALAKRQGVIVAPCGAGKTMIGLELAARLRKKTLWLTHTQDLLNQSLKRAVSVFELSGGDFGTITDGKVDIGDVITFATVQTACKLDLDRYADVWDVVIVDECHRVSGTPTRITMFSRVLSHLCARHKFGLTATPKRSDGLTPCMFALLGDKVAEISKSNVETICPVKVQFVKTDYEPRLLNILNSDGTINYTAYINDISADEERNELIAEQIGKLDGTVLVLTDRVFHETLLHDKLTERGIESEVLSLARKKDRQGILDNLRDKKIKVVLATYALAKEGLDIPTLDNLVLATPQRNEGTIVQSVGRVGRKADGKECGVVIDFEDDCVMFDNMAQKRRRIYKKNGWL